MHRKLFVHWNNRLKDIIIFVLSYYFYLNFIKKNLRVERVNTFSSPLNAHASPFHASSSPSLLRPLMPDRCPLTPPHWIQHLLVAIQCLLIVSLSPFNVCLSTCNAFPSPSNCDDVFSYHTRIRLFSQYHTKTMFYVCSNL